MAAGRAKQQSKSLPSSGSRNRNNKNNTTRGTTRKKSVGNSSRSAGSSSSKNKSAGQNHLRDEIMVLLSFACALILILSNFGLAGVVGEKIKWFMFGILGVIEYVFPIIIACSLIFLISNKDMLGVARVKTAAVYVLTIFLAALWQRIINDPDITDTGLGTFFTYSATQYSGGGFFGGIICKMLVPLGFWGSLVIIFIFIILCIILITEKSLIKGIISIRQNGKRVVDAARQDYGIYKEHSNEQFQNDNRVVETEEEYLERRRKQKEEKLRRNNAKGLSGENESLYEIDNTARDSSNGEKKTKRMFNKARGVTLDTELTKDTSINSEEQLDLDDIYPEEIRSDKYSDDIYDPNNCQRRESIVASEEDNILNNLHVDNETGELIDASKIPQDENNIQSDYDTSITPDFISAKPFAAPENASMDNGMVNQSDILNSVQNDIMNDLTKPAQMDNNPGDALQTGLQNTTEEKQTKKEYVFPPISLLKRNTKSHQGSQERENKTTAMRLQQTLQNFGVKVTITDISCGPSVTRYELQPEQGVKVSRIVSLSDDIKLNLAAADIRIEAPIPGKAAIGIEVPNKEAGSVSLRELLESDAFKKFPSSVAFAVGKDIAGKIIVTDIAKMPHLLIAGATGSGKSVCINTIIMSILYKASPDDVKMIMIDPKVVELSIYNEIPHLMTPVVSDPKKAAAALNWAVVEMTDRYKKFAKLNVRDIKGYNKRIENLEVGEGEEKPVKMCQIVIIIDELADLMMVSPGEVEDSICRLAQLARAAGIHLVIATQRPSVNVITGLIKANVPSRIAFSVASGVDSRTIIDMNGAEKLLGKGDMLFFPSGYPKPVRVQGAFVSDEEVSNVVDFLKKHNTDEGEPDNNLAEQITSMQPSINSSQLDERDAYFAEAGRFIIEKEKGSIGMLQRYYKIGFNRAARIMDQLADAQVVGPEVGTKPRKVLMTLEEFEQLLRNTN